MASGTADNPYRINSAEVFKRIAEAVNAGNDFAGKFFVLTADIELSEEWTPIGYRNFRNDDEKPFSGTFDGQGHTIKNLTIDNPSSDYQGLFGYVVKGTIKNLNLSNVNISGHRFVGGLVGFTYATVENCTVSVKKISGEYSVGGFVGRNYGGTIENCEVSGALIDGKNHVGGFVGRNFVGGNVEKCTVRVKKISGEKFVGGFVGFNDDRATVKNCAVSGATISGKFIVGGLVGFNDTTVENCTVRDAKIGSKNQVGGFVGRNLKNGKIKGSNHWHGNCSEAVGRNEGKIIGSVTRVDSGTCGNNVRWVLYKNVKLVIIGTGDMQDYSSTDRPEWDKNRDKIERVIVTKGVTSVGNWAFEACTDLKRVELPDGLENIGDEAFANCASLTNIELPDNLKKIGDKAFVDCTSLTNIKLPDGLEKIGAKAFANCTALVNIVIPPQVYNFGNNVFSACRSLEKIFYRAGENFVNELQADNSAEIIPYYRFDLPVGVTITSKPVFTTYYDLYLWTVKYFAETIRLKNSTGVVYVEIQSDTFTSNGYTFIFNGLDTFTVKIDERKTLSTDKVKPPSTDKSKPLSTDKVKPPSNNEGKPPSTDKVKPPSTDEGKPPSTDEGKPPSNNEGKPPKPTPVTPNIIYSGTCGDNVTWKLYKNGAFVVNGTGDMYNYSPNNKPPWYDECNKIKRVFVKKGVTSVGDWAFADCPNLKRVVLSSTVKSLKDHTFENCPSLKLYYRDGFRIITVRKDEYVSYDNDTVIVIGGTIFVDGTIYLPNDNDEIPIRSSVKKVFLLIHDPDKNSYRKIIKQLTATVSSEPPVIEVDTDLEDFGDSAFENAVFPGVKILEGVKSLGKRVFANCPNLTNIELPHSLKKIGDKAFVNCTALVNIVIPSKVENVGNNVFSGCTSLEKIFYRAGANFVDKLQAGNSAKTIPYYRFDLLPVGVTITSDSVFTTYNHDYFAETIWIKNSTGVVYVKIQSDTFTANGYTFTFDGVDTFTVTEDANKIMLDAAVSVDAQEIAVNAEIDLARKKIVPPNIIDSGTCGDNVKWTLYKDGTFVVSGTGDMQDYSYYTPAPWQPNLCDLIKKVVIEDGVTSVGKHTFRWCRQLTDAKISDSVTKFSERALYYCDHLQTLNVPARLAIIGDDAFWGCSKLPSFDIPATVSEIIGGAFGRCKKLRSLVIPATVKKIGSQAFADCTGLTSMVIPPGITEIDFFSGCKNLTNITLPPSVTKIGHSAFSECKNLTSANVAKILSNNITEIGKCAFENCTGLTGNITLPPSVTKIGYGVFNSCINLKHIYYHYIPGQWHETLKKKLTTGGNTKLHELP